MSKRQRYFSARRPARCPGCGSERVVRLVYGYPGPDLRDQARRGEVGLGGCLISEHDPSWGCADCGVRIHHERHRGSADDDGDEEEVEEEPAG